MELVNKLQVMSNMTLDMDKSLYLSGIDQEGCIVVYDCIDRRLIFNKKVSKGEIFGIYSSILLIRTSINEIQGYLLNTQDGDKNKEYLKYSLTIENFKPNRLKVCNHNFVYVDDSITFYDFQTGVIVSRGIFPPEDKFNLHDIFNDLLVLTQETSTSVYDKNYYSFITFELGTRQMYPKFIDADNILVSDKDSTGVLNISSGNFRIININNNQRYQMSSDKKLIAFTRQKTLDKISRLDGTELNIPVMKSLFVSKLSFNEKIAIFNSRNSLIILDLDLDRVLFEIPIIAEEFQTDFTNILAIKTKTNTEIWDLQSL